MLLGRMFKTRLDERKVTQRLAGLNTELALQMIALASETGDKEPLIEAVKSLRASEALFQPENTPVENAQLHKKLGDVLMKIGKDEQDMEALDYAIIAYRGAITIASLLGEDTLRAAARKNYALAKNLRGIHEPKSRISLLGAA